ncbi:uncharacterized protein STEHIDRAFT_154414 [Stereum hirsutum FP-91666 SS1]|uniref:uncharacterized protein n=1 Tax=Stereum hirsutum (strain FP-91666) TaxID=721885 RepID=UPI000440E9FE|nr:uncharacterized protein STEHIDRAFT_154414 [Stereum hirsutum FP-91666 SS1]EIM88688.1 hypothetical protein STEHIDRAFT_154414 [Stereum hirsutum FP-91666 SS1]
MSNSLLIDTYDIIHIRKQLRVYCGEPDALRSGLRQFGALISGDMVYALAFHGSTRHRHVSNRSLTIYVPPGRAAWFLQFFRSEKYFRVCQAVNDHGTGDIPYLEELDIHEHEYRLGERGLATVTYLVDRRGRRVDVIEADEGASSYPLAHANTTIEQSFATADSICIAHPKLMLTARAIGNLRTFPIGSAEPHQLWSLFVLRGFSMRFWRGERQSGPHGPEMTRMIEGRRSFFDAHCFVLRYDDGEDEAYYNAATWDWVNSITSPHRMDSGPSV